MAKYNTFLIVSTKGKPLLVTSSARKARHELRPGIRVEVWSENKKVDTIYARTEYRLNYYVEMEREYIRAKQEAAERRNKMRKRKGRGKHNECKKREAAQEAAQT